MLTIFTALVRNLSFSTNPEPIALRMSLIMILRTDTFAIAVEKRDIGFRCALPMMIPTMTTDAV